MNIYVNDTKIELAPGERIWLSKSVGRVGEIGTRSGVVSTDFDVLATAGNIETLGFNNLLESSGSVNPSNKQAAYIEDEGHEISRGFVQIASWDQVGRRIKLAFFGDNTNWFDLLRGKYIDDIDFTDLDHDWTEANIVASWTNTSGYIYPALDYGRLTGDTDFFTQVDDWYPAVYRHTIIERMFRDIGYRVTGEFLNTFAYKNCIIPFSNGTFEGDTSQLIGSAAKTSITSYTLQCAQCASTSDTSTQVADIDTILSDPSNSFNLSTDRYTASQALQDATFIFRFPGNLSLQVVDGIGVTMTIKYKIRKNGVTDLLDTTLLTYTAAGAGLETSTLTDFYEFSITETLAASDYIDAVFELSYTGGNGSTTVIDMYINCSSYRMDLDDLNALLVTGDPVSIVRTLPEITQIDLVRDMIMQNNLIVSGDPVSGVVNFTRFDKIYENMPDAVDWSDRVDLGGMRTIDFTEVATDFAKISEFAYRETTEDDAYITNYNADNDSQLGSGRLEVDNDFIPNYEIVYQSPFGATAMIDSIIAGTGTIPLGYIPYFDSVPTAGELESTPRILYVIPNATVSDFTIGGGTYVGGVKVDVTNYTECAYGYFTKRRRNSVLDTYTDNLAYDMPNILAPVGTGLLEANYSNLSRILNKPRYIEVSVRLWPHEFRDIDFTIPVYIHAGELQGYFYVDEIADYEGERIPTTVKLIQLV